MVLIYFKIIQYYYIYYGILVNLTKYDKLNFCLSSLKFPFVNCFSFPSGDISMMQAETYVIAFN